MLITPTIFAYNLHSNINGATLSGCYVPAPLSLSVCVLKHRPPRSDQLAEAECELKPTDRGERPIKNEPVENVLLNEVER